MILITGATGNVGRNVVASLAGREVRTLSRSASGPNAVAGDLLDPKVLDEALEGVEHIFLNWPMGPSSWAEPVIEKIGARHIVYLSSMTVDEHTDQISQTHADLERLIASSGAPWTFIRAGGFATNLLWEADQIKTGVVRKPFGAASRSLVHEADLGAVAARALQDDKYLGQKLIVTGPEAITQADQIRTIAEVTGRDIRFDEITPETALAEMLAQGWDRAMATGMLDYWSSLVEHPEPVTTTVHDVTGNPARTFRTWTQDHADAFR